MSSLINRSIDEAKVAISGFTALLSISSTALSGHPYGYCSGLSRHLSLPQAARPKKSNSQRPDISSQCGVELGLFHLFFGNRFYHPQYLRTTIARIGTLHHTYYKGHNANLIPLHLRHIPTYQLTPAIQEDVVCTLLPAAPPTNTRRASRSNNPASLSNESALIDEPYVSPALLEKYVSTRYL